MPGGVASRPVGLRRGTDDLLNRYSYNGVSCRYGQALRMLMRVRKTLLNFHQGTCDSRWGGRRESLEMEAEIVMLPTAVSGLKTPDKNPKQFH